MTIEGSEFLMDRIFVHFGCIFRIERFTIVQSAIPCVVVDAARMILEAVTIIGTAPFSLCELGIFCKSVNGSGAMLMTV